MYLWNNHDPFLDGDFDSGIIIHEIGHGVSNRLTGGPNIVGCLPGGQSGGMGEGWSDWWAIALQQQESFPPNMAFPMGDYVVAGGIRICACSLLPAAPPLPACRLCACLPFCLHSLVCLFGAAAYSTTVCARPLQLRHGDQPRDVRVHLRPRLLWRARHGLRLVRRAPRSLRARKRKDTLGLASDVAAGLSVYPCAQMRLEFGFDADWYDGTGGNNALWQDVHDGLKLQPCTPTMVDSRDAILLADEENYGGAHVCTMWCGFARRGLGVSAFSSGHQNRDVEEAFDFPPACGCGEIYRRADAAMKPENPAFTPKGR